MYTYGSFMLRFDRKQQNSVKAIILQFKNKYIKKKNNSWQKSQMEMMCFIHINKKWKQNLHTSHRAVGESTVVPTINHGHEG